MSFDAFIILTIFIACFMLFYFLDKQKLTKNMKAGTDFLNIQKDNPKVFTTSSGLQYLPLVQSKSLEQTLMPTPESTVAIHYHGTLINGTVFDSSKDQVKPINFELKNMISGLKEGILLMRKGDETRFFIPHTQAYGTKKTGNIEPGSTLIFDVKLIDFY